MSTGHQGDYGNAIMQKRGLLPRPDDQRRSPRTVPACAVDLPFDIDAKFHAEGFGSV
jgi:hypothetical protein